MRDLFPEGCRNPKNPSNHPTGPLQGGLSRRAAGLLKESFFSPQNMVFPRAIFSLKNRKKKSFPKMFQHVFESPKRFFFLAFERQKKTPPKSPCAKRGRCHTQVFFRLFLRSGLLALLLPALQACALLGKSHTQAQLTQRNQHHLAEKSAEILTQVFSPALTVFSLSSRATKDPFGQQLASCLRAKGYGISNPKEEKADSRGVPLSWSLRKSQQTSLIFLTLFAERETLSQAFRIEKGVPPEPLGTLSRTRQKRENP